MKLFELSIGTLMLRYYLMMGVVIVGGFSGNWWLAFLALPILMTCLMGMTFTREDKGITAVSLTVKHKELDERVTAEEVKTAA